MFLAFELKYRANLQTLKNSPYSFYMMLAPLSSNISNLGVFFLCFYPQTNSSKAKKDLLARPKVPSTISTITSSPGVATFSSFFPLFPPLLWVFIFISLRYEWWRREDEKEQMKLLSEKNEARRGKKREKKEKLKRFPQEFSAFNFPLCSAAGVFTFFGETWEGQSVRSRKIIERIQEMRIDTFYGILFFLHFLQQQGNCSNENSKMGEWAGN